MNKFCINENVTIEIPTSCLNDTVKDVIYGLFYRMVNIIYIPANGAYCKIGAPETEREYNGDGEGEITVTQKGIYVSAKDDKGVLDCLFMVLRKLEAVYAPNDAVCIQAPVFHEEVKPCLERRMIHFCIMENTSPLLLKKAVRVSGTLGYTHVILESFGAVSLDCIPEIAWKDSKFTKDDYRAVVKEIKDIEKLIASREKYKI